MNNDTELLSRRLLFGNPERTALQISPDGRHLAWVAPLSGVLNVWVAPLADLGAARPVTEDLGRGVRRYFWAYTSRDIIYLKDQNGDENWHNYRVNIETGEQLDLTPIEGIAAQIIEVSHRHPESILVGINDRDEKLHDLYQINVHTAERTLLVENPGFVSIICDHDYQVRFGQKMEPDGSTSIFKYVDGDWDPFDHIPYDDTLTTYFVGFDQSNERLVMVDSRGRNTSALTVRDVDSGAVTVLFGNERADVSNAMLHPVTREVQAAASNYEREEWTPLVDAIRPDFDYLRELSEGEFAVTSRTLEDDYWIVTYFKADRPVRYYLYDRKERRADYLFSDRPALEDKPLAPMHPVVITARDGLELVSYLTLPMGADPNGDARPLKPLPMVLLVHGGPWARDSYGFNAYHQWLANRGYAVLSVNFRGSTGFGKAFVKAGDREWAGAMHNDLLDAVNWALEEGVTEQDAVAIMGGSYGGYSALTGLTFTPKAFACGISIVGPSNLVTLLESFPPYWAPMIDMLTNRVGDPRTQEGRAFLKLRSPLTYVDQIQRPLLIGQGANDVRVKQNESDQIVEAMRERGIPVTYALYPDEGHGFARPPNNLSFNAVVEGFLGACLGGRVEPIGGDLDGSTIQVPEGAEYVDGLKQALAAKASTR